MHRAAAIRWIAVGLHAVVLIFGVVILGMTTGIDVAGALRRSYEDPILQKIFLLTAIVVGGNLIGAILIGSRLFNSRTGIYALLGYEITFLLVSLPLLSIDYSVVIAFVIAGLLYVAKLKRTLT